MFSSGTAFLMSPKCPLRPQGKFPGLGSLLSLGVFVAAAVGDVNPGWP